MMEAVSWRCDANVQLPGCDEALIGSRHGWSIPILFLLLLDDRGLLGRRGLLAFLLLFAHCGEDKPREGGRDYATQPS